MSLDVPEQVRKTVMANGNESWLDELPGMVGSLAQEWSLTIGSSLAGGHVALVLEVTLHDGTPAVLKVGVPGRDIGPEATLLRLGNRRAISAPSCVATPTSATTSGCGPSGWPRARA